MKTDAQVLALLARIAALEARIQVLEKRGLPPPAPPAWVVEREAARPFTQPMNPHRWDTPDVHELRIGDFPFPQPITCEAPR